MSENDFECLARTGENTLETMFSNPPTAGLCLVAAAAEPSLPTPSNHLGL